MTEIKRRLILVTAATALFVALSVGTAFANGPFLCPVVGDGVLNADSKNGDNGVAAITPPVGTSLLPGKNKAGEKANPNAYNTKNPDDPTAGPGGNPDFSPIWPGDTIN